MDVCKCIVPLWHESTLNSRRAASPLVRLVEGEERREASDHPQGILSQNRGGTEQNRTFTCMVLKATANDKRTTSPCHDEFLGLWSDVTVDLRRHNENILELRNLISKGKAGKVSKTRNALDVRRLLTPLKTLKKFLRWFGRRFQSADEIKSASQAELKDMAKNGYQKCFDDRYKRWNKCVVA
ncbi:uncharacterized protein TNCV_4854241 [Trichonephila clavipes]|nr:uncharacterized protein TNCV_4854241 [Trichonephila clavipes]